MAERVKIGECLPAICGAVQDAGAALRDKGVSRVSIVAQSDGSWTASFTVDIPPSRYEQLCDMLVGCETPEQIAEVKTLLTEAKPLLTEQQTKELSVRFKSVSARLKEKSK